MPEKDWIIFDAMGVIFEVGDDTNELLVPYIQRQNAAISTIAIQQEYLKASLGQISSATFWEHLGCIQNYPGIEKDYLDTCLHLDPDFAAIAEKLSMNYSLAMLSNDVKEWADYLRAKFDLNRHFNTVIISGDVGCRKPDSAIYHILLETIQTSAKSCVFIDDRGENLSQASELGFYTIRFVRDPSTCDFSADATVESFSDLSAVVAAIFRKGGST